MKIILSTFLACAASMSFAAMAATSNEKTAYQAAKTAAITDYSTAKEKCKQLSGNAKDVCIEEAKAARTRTESEAMAQYENTDKARSKARIAIADAEYDVAKAKCGGITGNEKDVCVKEAKSAKSIAIADAKADKKVAAARAEAREDIRDAKQDAAVEKCRGLSGDLKDSCITTARNEINQAAGTDAVAMNNATANPNVVSDTVITTKIKTDLLKEPNLKSLDIHVETSRGVVQLSGFVNSDADAAKAVELARGVKGVTSVKNEIKLK